MTAKNFFNFFKPKASTKKQDEKSPPTTPLFETSVTEPSNKKIKCEIEALMSNSTSFSQEIYSPYSPPDFDILRRQYQQVLELKTTSLFELNQLSAEGYKMIQYFAYNELVSILFRYFGYTRLMLDAKFPSIPAKILEMGLSGDSIDSRPLCKLPAEIMDPLAGLPKVIIRLMHLLTQKIAIAYEDDNSIIGVFRISSNEKILRDAYQNICIGYETYDFNLADLSPILLANLLKSFIRKIPGFIVPRPFVEFLHDCHQISDEKDRRFGLKMTLLLLPHCNLNALFTITAFLKCIAVHYEIKTRMSVEALANIMAPTIFDLVNDLQQVKDFTSLLAEFINQWDFYFLMHYLSVAKLVYI